METTDLGSAPRLDKLYDLCGSPVTLRSATRITEFEITLKVLNKQTNILGPVSLFRETLAGGIHRLSAPYPQDSNSVFFFFFEIQDKDICVLSKIRKHNKPCYRSPCLLQKSVVLLESNPFLLSYLLQPRILQGSTG